MVTWVTTMIRITTVREFRDKATKMFRSKDPVLVLRKGKVAGVFFPYPNKTLPLEFKRELFSAITEAVARKLGQAGINEEEILADFQDWQKAGRQR